MNRKRRVVAGVLVAGAFLAACGTGAKQAARQGGANPPPGGQPQSPATQAPQGSLAYRPQIDPAAFSTTIDNPFLPWVPGTRRIYEAQTPDGVEHIVVEVTRDTKTVMGVECVVVRDTVAAGGKVVEDTFDWYSQDRSGAVWYFGEATTKWENGVASTEGSWEAGVDGAQPGIVMPPDPTVGATYRQEFLAGHAEDMITILSVGEGETVAYGSFKDMVLTVDYTPLDSSTIEHKYYARGVGNVLVLHVKGPAERMELIRIEQF